MVAFKNLNITTHTLARLCASWWDSLHSWVNSIFSNTVDLALSRRLVLRFLKESLEEIRQVEYVSTHAVSFCSVLSYCFYVCTYALIFSRSWLWRDSILQYHFCFEIIGLFTSCTCTRAWYVFLINQRSDMITTILCMILWVFFFVQYVCVIFLSYLLHDIMYCN